MNQIQISNNAGHERERPSIFMLNKRIDILKYTKPGIRSTYTLKWFISILSGSIAFLGPPIPE